MEEEDAVECDGECVGVYEEVQEGGYDEMHDGECVMVCVEVCLEVESSP